MKIILCNAADAIFMKFPYIQEQMCYKNTIKTINDQISKILHIKIWNMSDIKERVKLYVGAFRKTNQRGDYALFYICLFIV